MKINTNVKYILIFIRFLERTTKNWDLIRSLQWEVGTREGLWVPWAVLDQRHAVMQSRHRDGKAPDWIMRWQIQIYQKSSDLSCLGWISISWVTEFFVNLSSESSQSKCSNFFLSKIIILLASSQIWPPGTFLSRSSNFTSSLKGNWEFCDPKSYNSRLKVTWERKVILV